MTEQTYRLELTDREQIDLLDALSERFDHEEPWNEVERRMHALYSKVAGLEPIGAGGTTEMGSPMAIDLDALMTANDTNCRVRAAVNTMLAWLDGESPHGDIVEAREVVRDWLDGNDGSAVDTAGKWPRPGHGFAVVRTADVEQSAKAVEDYARLLSGTAFDWHWELAQRMKEAIR